MRWIAGFILLLVATDATAATKYAVVIGNNRGRKTDRPLAYAERDAVRFAAVLSRWGSVPAENTVTLLGEDRDAIRRALLDINARVRVDDADAELIVYYSGHADAAGLHVGRDVLSYDEIKGFLKGSPARVRVLILDGCRSGGITNVKGVEPAPTFTITEHYGERVEGLAMISSSAAGEDSHESERLEASFFTHHLLSALKGAGDRNRDARITLSEAYEYAYHNTLRSSGRTTSLQHPTYAYDMKGRGDLVMTRLDRSAGRSSHLVLDDPGVYLVVENEEGGEVVAEVVAAEANTRLVLLPGEYFVQARADDHYREYDVTLGAGETTKLDGLDYERVAYAELVRKGGSDRQIAHAAFVLGTVRGEVLKGEGPAVGGAAIYVADLEWASLSARVRAATTGANQLDRSLVSRQTELAVGIAGQRFFDFASGAAFGVGFVAEGIHMWQRFDADRTLEGRSSFGLALGLIFTAEIVVTSGLALRVEGGPTTYLLRAATTRGGVQVDDEFASRFTGWAAAGFGWRL